MFALRGLVRRSRYSVGWGRSHHDLRLGQQDGVGVGGTCAVRECVAAWRREAREDGVRSSRAEDFVGYFSPWSDIFDNWHVEIINLGAKKRRVLLTALPIY